MSSNLDKYLNLLSKAFILHEESVRLNVEIQVTVAKHLQGSWLLDSLVNCLNLIFGERQDFNGKVHSYMLALLSYV